MRIRIITAGIALLFGIPAGAQERTRAASFSKDVLPFLKASCAN